MNTATLIDDIVDAITPALIDRGFVRSTALAVTGPASPEYDEATCKQFLDPEHIGDSVLERARIFFGVLDRRGQINSLELVDVLGLKGPTSIPANLTIPLKKSQRRLGLPKPWTGTATPDGLRTVWQDRDGVAGRMVKAIEEEHHRRGLA